MPLKWRISLGELLAIDEFFFMQFFYIFWGNFSQAHSFTSFLFFLQSSSITLLMVHSIVRMIWQPIRDARQFWLEGIVTGMDLFQTSVRGASDSRFLKNTCMWASWRIVLSDALFLCRDSCGCLKKGDAERLKVAKEAKQCKVPAWHFFTLQMLCLR